MSNRFYRLNIRFDLTDECQRLIAEKLQSLDRKQYGSVNKFIIAAIGNTLDGNGSHRTGLAVCACRYADIHAAYSSRSGNHRG